MGKLAKSEINELNAILATVLRIEELAEPPGVLNASTSLKAFINRERNKPNSQI